METWLEIDLKKLKNNFEYIREKSKSPICSVIKADSYGLGVKEIASELDKLETDSFAVAFFHEALELRRLGIEKEILVFNYIPEERLIDVEKNNLTITLYSIEQLNEYISSNLDILKNISFHIKINTGMNRLGFDEEQLDYLIEIILKNNLKIEGVYSHFAHVEDYNFSNSQNNLFLIIADKLEMKLNKTLKKHLANSVASVKYEGFYHNMIRVGMLLYGLQPLGDTINERIKCIFTWKSKITNIRKVKKGERISYGDFVVPNNMEIATIPVGYSHGYMRQLSNKAKVFILGKKYPIIGKICMDQMLVDISKMDENRRLGVEVEVLGDNITPEYLAKLSETIPDDIICKINPNIKRIIKR